MVTLDSSVCGFDVGCFKRRFSNDKSVDNNSEGPDVDFIGMTRSSLEDLRSDIVWSTANSSLLFSVKIEFCGQTKVSQFDLHLVVEEQVSKLEVSMDDPVGMEVLERIDDLQRVALDLQLVESLPSFQQLVQTVV